MLMNYLAAIVFLMILLGVWCAVQHWARSFARHHPEFGPAREEGGGCGLSCKCGNPGDEAQCRRKNEAE